MSRVAFLTEHTLLSRLLAVAVLASLGLALAALPFPIVALVLGTGTLLALTILEPMGGVVVLLLVAPMKALIETETVYTLPLDVGQIALLVLIIGLGVNRVLRREPVWLATSTVHIPLILFLVAVLLGLPGALSSTTALSETLKWVEIILLVSLTLLIYRRGDAQWLVFALVLSGATQAVVGLYEFFGGSGAEHLWILDQTRFRAFGSFGQPNPFGAFMGMTLPFAAMAVFGHMTAGWRKVRQDGRPSGAVTAHAIPLIFYGLSAGLIAAGLMASWSRGAWLGCAASFVLMALLLPRSHLQRLSLFLVGSLLLLGIWQVGLVPDAIVSRMGSFASELSGIRDIRGIKVTDENYAVLERFAHWMAAERMAQQRPWLGVGFGNYEVAYPQYRLLHFPHPLGHAHNYYLNLLAETGLIGLVAYLIMWAVIAVQLLRLWWQRHGLERAWTIALMGAFAYIAIHSLVDKLYVNNLFMHIGMMFGLLALLMAKEDLA